MAATKASVEVYNQAVASSGGAIQPTHDLRERYESIVYIKLTNGATGPSTAAEVQIELSPDNANWWAWGKPLKGNTDNNGVESFAVELPLPTMYVRFTVTRPGSQSVTVLIMVGEVTALLWG